MRHRRRFEYTRARARAALARTGTKSMGKKLPNTSKGAGFRTTRAVRSTILGLCLFGLLAQVGYALSGYKAEALMLDALEAGKRRGPEAALQLYLRAEAWSPGDPQLFYLQGLQWSKLGKTAEAKAAYARSLELAPGVPVTLMKYAEVLALSGEAQAADEAIHRALEIVPADSLAREIAGLVRGVQGDHAGAAKHFERAVNLSTNPSPKLLNRLAYSLYKLEDHNRALRYIDQALLVDADHPDNHLLRGKILLVMNRPDDATRALASAEREFLRLLATNPSNRDKLNETRRYLTFARRPR